MQAVELTGFEGFQSLRVVEVNPPRPGPGQVLIAVKAAGINFAELELAKGRYPSSKQPPFIMGFEAAGTVVEAGPQVSNVRAGDNVTAVVASGGYAEYATAGRPPASRSPGGPPSRRRPRSRSRDYRPTRF